jgi:DnaA-homolog protein
MTLAAAQIPFELFEAEPPTLDNFLIGDNAEIVSLLRAIAADNVPERCVTIWGGNAVGKTHLLKASVGLASRGGRTARFLATEQIGDGDPFTDLDLLAVDEVSELDAQRQTWLFTAFNHITARGGTVLASAPCPAMQMSAIRDDLRTRLGSGVVAEIRAVPQDALAPMLFDYALQRGVQISEEVLTYVLSYNRRDISHLCQLIGGIDRYSLSLKRPITIPLVRAYLTQQPNARG